MPTTHHDTNYDFVSAFTRLFGRAAEHFEQQQNPGRGPQPKLPASQLLGALVYHVLGGAGNLSARVRQLFKVDIKDSSLSERRQRIGLAPFEWLMRHSLAPMADRRTHKQCFFKGLRLCGIDGTCWSVTNTPQILERMNKAAARRLQAAFAKVEMCALVELGIHNPLAAVVGLRGEGEWDLAERLLGRLPERSLLLVDRLYGCGQYANRLIAACEAARGHLLVRARGNVKSHKAEKLADGSALVTLKLRDQGGKCRAKGEIRVREIRGRVRKPGSKSWSDVRLWTTLLDPAEYPAVELLELYARRWEHEIFYKELKIEMRGGDVLQSHTPVTAAQEVAALLMGAAIIARERADAARSGRLQPLGVSFVKTLEKTGALWEVFAVSEGLLDEETMAAMAGRMKESIARESIPKRRKRNCPRKVRQPVGKWPRLTENESNTGEYTTEIISFP